MDLLPIKTASSLAVSDLMNQCWVEHVSANIHSFKGFCDLPPILLHARSLKKLFLTGMKTTLLPQIFKLNQITHLVIENLKLKSSEIVSLLSCASFLQVLVVRSFHGTWDSKMFAALPGSILALGVSGLPHDALPELKSVVPQLKKLAIYNTNYDANDILQFMSDAPSNLNYLKLRNGSFIRPSVPLAQLKDCAIEHGIKLVVQNYTLSDWPNPTCFISRGSWSS